MGKAFIMAVLLCASTVQANMEGASPPKEVPTSQSNAILGRLSTVINNYISDPESSLSNQDVSDLTEYSKHSLENLYDTLNQNDRANLSQIINLNSSQFSQSVLSKFNDDQKLAARMSTQDIERLKAIVVAIRDGKSLNAKQVADVKDFKVFMSNNSYAFIPELSFITQYVSLNPGQFSSADLATFRQASADASGLTPDDIRSLNTIANNNTTNINREDVKVLRNFALKSPLGTLNTLDAQAVFTLYEIINANTGNFSSNTVSTFNNVYNNNQGVQISLSRMKDQLKMPQKDSGPTSAGQRQ